VQYPKTTDNPDGGNVSTVGSASEIPVMVVPINQKVRIREESRDVIHSFWVPEFLFKRDVIPMPKPNEFEFEATHVGHYVGRCAELCGTYHSQMNFEVRVVTAEKYKAYLAKLAEIGPADPVRQRKALAAIGEDPCATTTHPFTTSRTARAESAAAICVAS
jgi:cytochrome c oxidase subunit 2